MRLFKIDKRSCKNHSGGKKVRENEKRIRRKNEKKKKPPNKNNTHCE